MLILESRNNTRAWPVSKFMLTGLFIFCCLKGMAQAPVIQSYVDTASIRIGQQIRFSVLVEVDSSSSVIFPDGQTFSPLETVEAFQTDTTRKKDRMTLEKMYALTQFDSGTYVLPTQRIEIDGKGYFTDSVEIAVANVPVDTLTQNLYDIKPLIQVEKDDARLWMILGFVLLALLVAGGGIYYFFFRKKTMTEEEKEALLPPYDRALLELRRLENSRYLIQDEYKKYYSELTAIVRSYLEEEVHVFALESTTDQLIDKLELMKDSGELNLTEDTIIQFKKILQTADLVKFARSKPVASVAEDDRKSVEQIVIKTKEALPEPTEEELMQQGAYQEVLARNNQRRKLYIVAGSALSVIVLAFVISISYFGFRYVKDSLLGNPTKTLLEGEWVNSSYGFPPIHLETPEVLTRQEDSLNSVVRNGGGDVQAFAFNSQEGVFSIGASSTTFSKPEEPKFDETIEGQLKKLEEAGARNIITKKEEFITTGGVKGLKVYGSCNFAMPDSNGFAKGSYLILLFGGNGFQQQITISWLDDDPYAEEMAERIQRSVDVKAQV